MTDANTGTSAPFDCAGDPTAGLIEMFVGLVQEGQIKRGQRPAERPVFRKLHGTAHGRLEMCAEAPDDLRVGIFAYDALDVWMRFSSDAAPTDPDLKSTVGIAIKAFRVPAAKRPARRAIPPTLSSRTIRSSSSMMLAPCVSSPMRASLGATTLPISTAIPRPKRSSTQCRRSKAAF